MGLRRTAPNAAATTMHPMERELQFITTLTTPTQPAPQSETPRVEASPSRLGNLPANDGAHQDGLSAGRGL